MHMNYKKLGLKQELLIQLVKRQQKGGPGPQCYDVQHRIQIGKTGARHHFHTKPKEKNPLAEVPGPADYEIQDKRSGIHSPVKFTIPKAKQSPVRETPGPQSYNSHSAMVKHNWKFGIKIFTQKRKTAFALKQKTEANTPGPASYRKEGSIG